MEGLIIKNISNDYTVLANNNYYNCKARGRFRKDNIIPLVGDHVVFDEKEKYIKEIKTRKNMLIRPSVANIDQALIVTSVKEPELSTVLLDKMLTIISYNNIKPIICFTKTDLLNEKEILEFTKLKDYYESVGYQTVINIEKETILKLFKNKVTVFTGQSGAGKSTLLNNLDKNLTLKTGEISKVLGRGKHTTRHTELFQVASGFVVDTPGFSSLDFNEMTKMDIRDNMNEMFDNLEYCKYRDCMHLNEDGCMVKEKVTQGIVLKSRYDNYKNFISKGM